MLPVSVTCQSSRLLCSRVVGCEFMYCQSHIENGREGCLRRFLLFRVRPSASVARTLHCRQDCAEQFSPISLVSSACRQREVDGWVSWRSLALPLRLIYSDRRPRRLRRLRRLCGGVAPLLRGSVQAGHHRGIQSGLPSAVHNFRDIHQYKVISEGVKMVYYL